MMAGRVFVGKKLPDADDATAPESIPHMAKVETALDVFDGLVRPKRDDRGEELSTKGQFAWSPDRAPAWRVRGRGVYHPAPYIPLPP